MRASLVFEGKGPEMTAFAMVLAAMTSPTPVIVPVCERRCRERVQQRRVRAHWRSVVDRYGRGLLAARRACESGTSGGYGLATTGNSYWFAYQHDIEAWTGSGGRVRGGRPVGVWSTQPTPLEQDFRAARWDAIHGGDAWPNCP